MTEQVDTEARINAAKALTIIFILAIIAVNVLLIFKFARQGRFLLSQRRFIIVTLAGGDILVALFPLVVQARGLFEEYFDCHNAVISKVYGSWFFPFVYGVAFVVLSLELINRKKIRKIISNPGLASVFLAAIPWISALVLVLPLGVAGFTSYTHFKCYWDQDFTEDRMRACYIIGAIIPSILAVVVAFWASSKIIDPEPEVFETMNPQAGTVLSGQTIQTYPYQQQPFYPNQTSQTGHVWPAQYQHFTEQQPGASEAKNPQQINYTGTPLGAPPPGYDVATQQYAAPAYPAANPTYPVAQPTYPAPNPTYPVAQPAYAVSQPYYPTAPQTTFSTAALPVQHRPAQAEASISTSAATQNEKQTLVMVAITNAILILPMAFYFMCYAERISEVDRMDPVPEAVVSDLCTWLMFLRSVVVPLIWLCKNRAPA